MTYPEALIKEMCKNSKNLAIIVNLLLVKNTEIRRTVIKFIGQRLIDYKYIKDTSIIEMLINCLDENTGMESLILLKKLQEIHNDYNTDLNIEKNLSQVDIELIKNNTDIRKSVFLRFLPICLIRYLVDENYSKNALTILVAEDFSKPTLIWNKEMHNIFKNTLKTHLAPLKNAIRKFVFEPGQLKLENMPIFIIPKFNHIIKYPIIDSEIRCGEYFIRPWIKSNGPLDEKSAEIFIVNLGLTLKSVILQNSEKLLEEIDTVLQAFDIFFTKYFSKMRIIKDIQKYQISNVLRTYSK